jgi:DNA-binding HxlR family transcriptional regulator
MGTNIETEEKCPVEAIAEIIGRKWVSLILRDLAKGPQRFGELEHSIKVSPRILSMRLQELEADELITRAVFAEVPPRTEYSLTERGKLLIPLIDTMREVGKAFI